MKFIAFHHMTIVAVTQNNTKSRLFTAWLLYRQDDKMQSAVCLILCIERSPIIFKRKKNARQQVACSRSVNEAVLIGFSGGGIFSRILLVQKAQIQSGATVILVHSDNTLPPSFFVLLVVKFTWIFYRSSSCVQSVLLKR